MASAPKRLRGLAAAVLLFPGPALAAGSAAAVPAAAAPAPPEAAPSDASPPAAPSATPPDVPATRRSGFTAGLMAGFGVASVVGYPNDAMKIGHASAYTVTGVRPGGQVGVWIGGALTDWFTFGLGYSGGRLFATGSNTATSQAGVFHIEAFPLFPLGGRWRDLGAMFDFGLGFASVTDPSGTKLVDSSSASYLGGGVFYEGIRFWKIGQGPFLRGDYVWSDTALRPGIFAGWRVALYTRP